MHSTVQMCGFSHHTQPFVTEDIKGLPGYLFRLQTEGNAMALVNGSMRRIEAGELLLYRPGDAYALAIEPIAHPQRGQFISSSDYFVSCHGKWIDRWWATRQRPQVIRIDDMQQLVANWRMLILEKRRGNEYNAELMEYLLRCLCLLIDRVIEDRYAERGRPFVASRMKAYIEEHATASFRLEDLAAHVSLSVSRTSHLFKEYFGKTVIEYMHEVRFSIAEERMKYSTMTLEQIAETCGFGSYSYFFRVFRSKYGMSPAEFRGRFERSPSLPK